MNKPLIKVKLYLFSGFYHSTTRVAKVVKISAQELDRVKQNRNGVVGDRFNTEFITPLLGERGENANV